MNSVSSKNNGYPTWFSSQSFNADSSSFLGYGTAIAADSNKALQRATIEAKTNLDLEIGSLAEKVRTQLSKNGVKSVEHTEFILILRNAHADALEKVIVTNNKLSNRKGVFRAFVEVTISKKDLFNQLKKGFTGHPKYWESYSNTNLFKTLFN